MRIAAEFRSLRTLWYLCRPMISLNDFEYDLPDNRIAMRPADERDGSRLLVFRKGEIRHQSFRDLPEQLPQGSLLIFNDTRVIPARLEFFNENGARIEIFLLNPSEGDHAASLSSGSPARWICMTGNRKRWKPDTALELQTENLRLSVTASGEGEEITLNWSPSELPLAFVLEQAGKMPLPPYIKRAADEADKDRYQTVFAQNNGAVAAPTASLHFTPQVLGDLDQKGIDSARVTLHVGAGTFLPVKTENILEHRMHAEQTRVSRSVIEKILNHDGPVIPVGTTSLRTLESLFWIGHMVQQQAVDLRDATDISQDYPYLERKHPDYREVLKTLLEEMLNQGVTHLTGATSLFIRPGYRFGITRGLITNFHQPKSTLLMLIASLIGDDWKKVYQEALMGNYRFLSYGDSSLLLP